MTEATLLANIRQALNLDRRVRVVRNSVGFDSERKVRYGLGIGSADLVGLVIGSGRVFALEVKTSTGRLTKEQTLWLRALRSLGGFACEVRSVDAAMRAVGRAIDGASE